MLALYLSYSMGLPRPFWAMTTAYIVSQPWSGAVRSKALYRLVGTFVGSAMTVYMVPRLSNSPVVMTAAMALWVGACLYMSVLDRTPRSYLFMLAGYTAAMIGFPSVSEPTLVFDTALARVEEIALGIVCATLVHSVVLPPGAGADAAAGQGRARRPALDARHPGRRRRRQVRQGPPHPGQRHHPAAPAVDPRAVRHQQPALDRRRGARHAGPRRGADAHCLGRRGPHARPAGRRPAAAENVTRLLASISKWIDAGRAPPMPPRCGCARPPSG